MAAAFATSRLPVGLSSTLAANDGRSGDERVLEKEVAWLVGGDETR